MFRGLNKGKGLALLLFLFPVVGMGAGAHLEIKVPDTEEDDLFGPVKSLRVDECYDLSDDHFITQKTFNRSGDILTETEWDKEGKKESTITNQYDESGTFIQQIESFPQKKKVKHWKITLNPEKRKIAWREEESGRLLVYTYSPEKYLVRSKFVGEDKKPTRYVWIKRGEDHRELSYTRADGKKKPTLSIRFKWDNRRFITQEMLTYPKKKKKVLHAYEYLKVDKHGNWTQCLMTSYDISGKEKTKIFEKQIRRKIKYFEEEPPKDTETHVAVDSSTFSINTLTGNLVSVSFSINGEHRSCKGFIASMDGKDYIFTPQQKLLGAKGIHFETSDGVPLSPSGVEIAPTRDLVRFALSDWPEQGLSLAEKMPMGLPIGVFSSGVSTGYFGKITGVGAQKIEVSAQFPKWADGSPVFNTNRVVVGMASYVRKSRKTRWNKGTKFENKVRRFCCRLDGVSWQPVNWKNYNAKYGSLYRENTQFIDGILDILEEWSDDSIKKPVKLKGCHGKDLLAWKKTHNRVIEKYNTGKKQVFASEFCKSLEALSGKSKIHARITREFLKKNRPPDFLRKELDLQASTLEYFTDLFGNASVLLQDLR